MQKNKLLNKFVTFSFGSVVTMFIGVFTTPFITRIISPDDYGKFSMFNMVINIMMIALVLGLDQSFVRFFYEEKELDRKKLLFDCLIGPVILSIVASIITLIFWKEVSVYLFDEVDIKLIIYTIIATVFSVLNRYGILVIRMQQKGKLFSLLQVIQKIFYLVVILVLYFLHVNGLVMLIVATLISTIVVTVYSIIVEKKFWSFRNIKSIKLKNSKHEIYRYGVPLVFTTIITWVFQSTDRIAILRWGSYYDTGIYASAFSLISLLNIIQTSFSTFWTPVAYEQYEKDKKNKKFFEDMYNIISFAMFFIGIGLIVFRDILVLLLGPKYREAAQIIPFLIYMPIMYTISETSVIGINFMKKPKYHLVISIAACIFNIVGNIVLVPIFGAKGAAISTGLAYILFFYLRTMFSKKFYNINYNLVRFSIVTLFMTLLTIYSTFNNTNLIYILLSVFNLAILFVLYRKEILSKYKTAKFNFKNWRS